MLDNLAEDGLVDTAEADGGAAPVICLAGRNELDLAAAWLLKHLLQRRGQRAAVFSPDAVATFNLDRLPLRGVSVVCLSSLSTTSTARARYLVRRLRRRARRATVVIGFWGQGGPEFSLDVATAATAADAVATTFAGAIAAIEAAQGEAHPGPETIPDKRARQPV